MRNKISADFKKYCEYYYNEKLLNINLDGKILELPYVIIYDNLYHSISAKDISFRIHYNNFMVEEKILALTEEMFRQYCTDNNIKEMLAEKRLRLFDIIKNNNKLELEIQMLNYVDCIHTNSIIDLKSENNYTSLRELLHNNGKLDEISNSKLANQFDISIALFTGDNCLVVKKIKSDGIIGEENLYPSIADSIMLEDIIDNNLVCKKLEKEFNLKYEYVDEIFFLGIARNLIKGGKTDIFFLVTTKLNNSDILGRYYFENNRNNSILEFVKFNSIKYDERIFITDKKIFNFDMKAIMSEKLDNMTLELLGSISLFINWINKEDLVESSAGTNDIDKILKIIKNKISNKSKDIIKYVEAYFEFISDEKEREFEIQIGNLIKLEIDKYLENVFDRILLDSNFSYKVKYASFYSLCTLYRRNKEYSKYHKLIDSYTKDFQTQYTFPHLKSMCLREIISLRKIGYNLDLKDSINLAKEAKNNLPNNIGVLHSYAVVVAMAFEEELYDINNEENKKELYDAIEIAQRIINKEDFAKFYSTYGRLLCIDGKYDEAKKNIRNAIDKEDKDKLGYALSIGDYQTQLLNVEFKKSKNEFSDIKKLLENKVEGVKTDIIEAREKLENEKTNNLEFLGFFTAIISFTIGSIQIANGQDVRDAARLIVVLAGSLLIVLGGFGTILHGKNRFMSNLFTGIMGIVMIILGLSFI
ncbi:membrane protein of unknown function [Acetoanaerobium sticklandii]|uniref:Uncharacterized protein n=1 Tax=Acetoanaerobium sticklandii (strain ATCC 12662 / DSM 519 / JCM 1433 / CCUG 9281 / NCIMB 10654 / HF) TaxID=499177 RepID=E3PVF2_ACESD|nr:hypothetical protein [Acetoanaerobium sticklandii]CBH20519.1 membrane protein of unknown function [Acetoanaerobium sticklandii]